MDLKQQQKFKLKNILNAVNSLINVYKEKNILVDEIGIENYNKLENVLNEFITEHLP